METSRAPNLKRKLTQPAIHPTTIEPQRKTHVFTARAPFANRTTTATTIPTRESENTPCWLSKCTPKIHTDRTTSTHTAHQKSQQSHSRQHVHRFTHMHTPKTQPVNTQKQNLPSFWIIRHGSLRDCYRRKGFWCSPQGVISLTALLAVGALLSSRRWFGGKTMRGRFVLSLLADWGGNKRVAGVYTGNGVLCQETPPNFGMVADLTLRIF